MPQSNRFLVLSQPPVSVINKPARNCNLRPTLCGERRKRGLQISAVITHTLFHSLLRKSVSKTTPLGFRAFICRRNVETGRKYNTPDMFHCSL